MKQRLLTGIVLACLFILPFYFGGLWFSSFALVAATLAYIEWIKMPKLTEHRFFSIISVIGLIAMFVSVLYFGQEQFLFPIVALIGLFYLVLTVFQSTFTMEQAGVGLLGLVYIGFGFLSLAELRNIEGFIWTLSILLMIVSTDTGAYIIGKKWGKQKLAPMISPNKTIEGAMGGMFVAMVLTIFLQSAFQPFEHYIQAIFFSLFVSVAGQLGDLVESAMKRHYGVKDSGKVLPGHGGVFDRTDSWIFVFIALWIIQLF